MKNKQSTTKPTSKKLQFGLKKAYSRHQNSNESKCGDGISKQASEAKCGDGG